MGFLGKAAKAVAKQAIRPSTLRGGETSLRGALRGAKDRAVDRPVNWAKNKTEPITSRLPEVGYCPCGKKIRSSKADRCSTKCAGTYPGVED